MSASSACSASSASSSACSAAAHSDAAASATSSATSSAGRTVPAAPARPGDALDRVDTPALLLDLDLFEANLQALHARVLPTGVKIRSHGKAHKCPSIALRQIAAGAVGLCCQKTAEAEVFVDAGIGDVLISNEVVGASKAARVAALARRARVGVCVDHPDPVRTLGAAARAAGVRLDALIEVDVGQGRCGVQSPEEAVALARAIADQPALRLRGLQAYYGSAQHLRKPDERAQAIARAAALVRGVRDALAAAGHVCEEITGGGTGTWVHEVASGLYTEIQPGSYVLMDVDYARNETGADDLRFAQALQLLATVISARPGHAVLDAGLKALAVDSGPPLVRDLPWSAQSVSDEHTVLKAEPGGAALAVGDRVRLIPGHCDPTVNLHDWIVAVRGDHVEAVWPIAARGALF